MSQMNGVMRFARSDREIALLNGSVGRVRKGNQRSVSVDVGSHGGAWRVDAALLTLAPDSDAAADPLQHRACDIAL
jgi:hypothetical protein